MKRKAATFISIALITALLAGCGGAASTAPASAPAAPAAEQNQEKRAEETEEQPAADAKESEEAGKSGEATETTSPAAPEAEASKEAAQAENGKTSDAQAAASGEKDAAEKGLYFSKGVYVSYAKEAEDPPKTHFYIFTDNNNGHTEDASQGGIGAPFSVEQKDGEVAFRFGSAEEEPQILTVTSAENGVVTGTFKTEATTRNPELVFEPVEGADPDTFNSADATGAAEVVSYKGKDGWSVIYDPAEFEVKEEEDGTSFLFKEGTPGANLVKISFIPEKQPEEALYNLTQSWEADPTDPDAIDRIEGFFPGTSDKWGYWRSFENKKIIRSAIAGEYHDGVLLFDFAQVPGEGEGTTISDALSELINSITYENFGPQKMYEYVPGTYVLTGEIDGKAPATEYSITLNEDHTGTIRLEEESDILWGSIALLHTTPPFTSYEYTIEGDSLVLNLDGDWVTFKKKVISALSFNASTSVGGTSI